MYDFMLLFKKFINSKKIMEVYYDDASKNAKYPYGVITDPYEHDLHYGTQLFFDILIWADNTIRTEILEKKVQDLKTACDRKIFFEIPAIVYCEGIKNVDDSDYDKVKKKISFVVKIM